MAKPSAPCHKCERREIGCHADCGEYGDYTRRLKKWNDARRALISEGQEADNFLHDNRAALKRKRGEKA